MSYDLLFLTDVHVATKHAAARAALAGRANWNLDEGHYSNEATGVYFAFNLSDDPLDEPDTETGAVDPRRVWGEASINFARPSPFITEALQELGVLAAAVGDAVFDPQTNQERFDPVAIRESWLETNGRSLRVTNEEQPLTTRDYVLAPRTQIEQLWNWNRFRDERQAALDEACIDVFVPRVSFREVGGRLASYFVWPEGAPVLAPQFADEVLLYFEEPRRRFGLFGSSKFRHAPLAEMAAYFAEAEIGRSEEGLAIYGGNSAGPGFHKAFRKIGVMMDSAPPGALTFEMVLDEEYLDGPVPIVIRDTSNEP